MTTYPLSEPATIYASEGDEVIGSGSLAECADLIADFPSEKRTTARIEMDELELRFSPQDVDELLRFLREESEGLSDQEISAISDTNGE